MEIKVVVVEDLLSASPAMYEASRAIPQIDVPVGYRIEGGIRKFIVIKNTKTIIVVIGPKLSDKEYWHKNILEAVSGYFKGFLISGGGNLTFKSAGFGGWSATFDDKSDDFGLYDPIILEKKYSEIIAKAFGIEIFFKWKKYVRA